MADGVDKSDTEVPESLPFTTLGAPAELGVLWALLLLPEDLRPPKIERKTLVIVKI